MSENSNEAVVDIQASAYREPDSADDFTPDPTEAFGTLDTSGTAGGAHEDIEAVTPVFEAARAQDLQRAARALDPNDTEVPESEVVLSTGTTVVHGDPEADKERVVAAAEAYEDEPVKVEDPSQTAAEDDAEAAKGQDAGARAASIEGQQAAAGAGGAKVQSDDAAQRIDAGAKGTTDTTVTKADATAQAKAGASKKK